MQIISFHSSVLTSVSEVNDGTMKITGDNEETVVKNRRTFLQSCGVSASQTHFVKLRYEGDNYCRYRQADTKNLSTQLGTANSSVADALVTREKNVALFLPLADCIGAVFYDYDKNVLMVSHLGRHNVEQYGGKKSIDYMKEHFGCKPKNICVWLSPAAGGENYPLFAFNNRSMHDVVHEQLMNAGVLPESISASTIDTTTNHNYFSHSEFLKGNRTNNGRFAVLAMIKP